MNQLRSKNLISQKPFSSLSTSNGSKQNGIIVKSKLHNYLSPKTDMKELQRNVRYPKHQIRQINEQDERQQSIQSTNSSQIKKLYKHIGKQQPSQIIYLENSSCNNYYVLNGFCRFHFKDGGILEGDFHKGYAKQAIYHTNYLRGWLKGKWTKQKGLYDESQEGKQYDQRGEQVYQGCLLNYQRHGLGTQYFGSQGSLSGEWKKGKKQGPFRQARNNFSLIGNGSYQNDTKIGVWKYKNNDEVSELNYGQNTMEFKKLKTVPKQSQQNTNIIYNSNHFMINTEQSLQKLKKSYQMLDDNILSSWSVVMQYYLAYKLNDEVVSFPLDLMKYFAGIYLKQRNYERVKYITNHFTINYNIFTFPIIKNTGKQLNKRILLIPIIKSLHYSLAVVQIQYERQIIFFTCTIYDSLRGFSRQNHYDSNLRNARSQFKYSDKIYQSSIQSKHRQQITYQTNPQYDSIYKVVQDYLLDELNQKVNQSQYSQRNNKIKSGISNMKLSYARCPSQNDGVSCGVFVCIFMYYLCTNHGSMPDEISKDKINDFREDYLYKILKNKNIDVQELQNVNKIFKQSRKF